MSKRAGWVVLCVLLATGAARAQSCADERGARAKVLVDRCLEVSPATHPPCNSANACDLIESEIRRGCGLLTGADRPGYCDAY